MLPAKRILLAAVGLPLLLALPACGTAPGYGDNNSGPPDQLAATGTPAPLPDASAAANGVGGGLEQPAGIPTDRLVAKTIPKMGKVVTDANGWVLYRFDKDTANPSASNCSGKCAAVWPPMLTDGNPTLIGLDRAKVGTVTRDDGSTQLTLGGWPLYRYIGDAKPGQWKGQMVNGTWFVSAPDGKKNLTCVPTATPTAAAPPADSGTDSGTGTGADPAETPSTGTGGDGY